MATDKRQFQECRDGSVNRSQTGFPNSRFPLVGEKQGPQPPLPGLKPRQQAHHCQGFPDDWWLEPDDAMCWQCHLIPLVPNHESVRQWREATRELAFAYLGPLADVEESRRIMAQLDSDLDLIRRLHQEILIPSVWRMGPEVAFKRLCDCLCEAIQIVVQVHERALSSPPETTLFEIAGNLEEPFCRSVEEAQSIWFESPIRQFLVRSTGPVFLDESETRTGTRIVASCYHDLALTVACHLFDSLEKKLTTREYTAHVRFSTGAGGLVTQRFANLKSEVRCESQAGIAKWKAEASTEGKGIHKTFHPPKPAAEDLPAYKVEEQPWQAPLPEMRDVPTDELVSLAYEIDIVLVTATDPEVNAVLRLLASYPNRRAVLKGFVGQETYYLGRFGNCLAAVTKCRMGSLDSGAAALATQSTLGVWRPKAIVMVGVAFGRDPSKQKIADVLVASQVISYEPQRIGEMQEVDRGSNIPANPTLLNRFENVPLWSFCLPDGSKCERHVGPLLSGEKLVDNPAFKAELFDRYPQAIGGDMEGVGLAAAAFRHGVPWILVKAICDWADGKKHKKHQPLAAAAAVSLVHHALSQADVLHGLRKHDDGSLKPPPQRAADPIAGLLELHKRFMEAQDRFPREVSFALVMIPHDERQAWREADRWFNDIKGPPGKCPTRCLGYATGGDTPETITIPASERSDGGDCPLICSLEAWKCWLLKHSTTSPFPQDAINLFLSLAGDACRLLDLRDCGMMLDGRCTRGNRGEYQHLLRWAVEIMDPEECKKLTWLDPPNEQVRTSLQPGRTPRRWVVEMPCVFAAVAHALERHVAGLGKPWPSA